MPTVNLALKLSTQALITVVLSGAPVVGVNLNGERARQMTKDRLTKILIIFQVVLVILMVWITLK